MMLSFPGLTVKRLRIVVLPVGIQLVEKQILLSPLLMSVFRKEPVPSKLR